MVLKDLLFKHIFSAVQHERGPRNTTLRRQQMAHFFQDSGMLASASSGALGLAMPRVSATSPGVEHALPIAAPRALLCPTAPQILPRVSPAYSVWTQFIFRTNRLTL